VGVFIMRDEAGQDAKLLCVPATDPRVDDVDDLKDVPDYELNEIAHFFAIYKALEPGKNTDVEGWQGRVAAEGIVDAAHRRFRDRSGPMRTDEDR
jgi:inorganic pyrophosphatase